MKEVEDYANSDDIKFDDESPHHIFHVYSPAVLCNLLPVPVTVMDEVVICCGLLITVIVELKIAVSQKQQ